LAVKTIDASMLKKMFLSGAKELEINKEWINELNVFPVPDGDTGTNMSLTIMSAVRAVCELPEPSLAETAKAMSSGSLRGARGNSGVILSQLFRGFAKVVRDHDEIDAQTLASACERAVETAYKAVMKPKEGTILTVAKSMSEMAAEHAKNSEDLSVLLDAVVRIGDDTLERTPEMLPVLKEAGVVDSGGQGLMKIIHGAVDAFNGKEVDMTFGQPEAETEAKENPKPEESRVRYGYCAELVLTPDREFGTEEEKSFRDYLAGIGDSIILISSEGTVKLHVHTNDPGLAIQKALGYGAISKVSVDNLAQEHSDSLFNEAEKCGKFQAGFKPEPPKEVAKTPELKKNAFIAVTIGDGIGNIFRELGVDSLIEGGQTMNPSTEDILEAIEKVHAENVYILPNNKNIILSANQAKVLTKNCNVVVVPTRTIPQGITAVVSFLPDRTPDENLKSMTEEISRVQTGEVTYAVRDTKIDGKTIHTGDIMGIGDSGILSVGTDILHVTIDMLRQIVDEESELISIYRGADMKPEDLSAIEETARQEFPNVDVETNEGGQPVYYCIVSVE
jgi:DAK2 domain fusion protein YloV